MLLDRLNLLNEYLMGLLQSKTSYVIKECKSHELEAKREELNTLSEIQSNLQSIIDEATVTMGSKFKNEEER